MEPDAYPGKPPKNIGKKDVCVYQLFRRDCFELIRFKTSANSVYHMIPKMKNGTHISFHAKEIHMKTDGGYFDVDIDSFYAANKLFIKFRSPCFCIRIGSKIEKKDLNKIFPILAKFLPIEEKDILHFIIDLIKKRYLRFSHPRIKTLLPLGMLFWIGKKIRNFKKTNHY